MLIKNLSRISLCCVSPLLIATLLWSGQALAAQYACSNEYAAIGQYHDSGMVVTGSDSNGCGAFTAKYTFEYPSTSTEYICSPSNPFDHLSSEYVVVGVNPVSNPCQGSSNSYKVEYASGSDYDVCDNYPIPVGYVVTNSEGTRCDSGSNHIERADGRNFTKCDLPAHPVPEGYVITSIESDGSCGNGSSLSGPAKDIEVPDPSRSTPVCHGTIVPPGFVYKSHGTSRNCAISGSGESFSIGPAEASVESACVQYHSDVPDGYVITGVDSTGGLCGSYSAVTISRPDPQGTDAYQVVLGDYIIPDGYIITSKSAPTNNSGAVGGYHIKQVDSQASTREPLCAPSVIPEGWGVVSQESNQVCSRTTSSTTVSYIEPMLGDGPYTICSGQAVPTGFVISGYRAGWNAGCSTGWIVKRPDQTPGVSTTTCHQLFSDIPEGFSVVGQLASGECNDLGGFKISRPYPNQSTRVCAGSPIPTGFAITSQSGPNSGCGSVIGTYNIQPMTGSGPYTVCNLNQIPPGYVITSTTSDSVCGDASAYRIILPDPDGTTYVCSTSPIPSDYVISAVTSSGNCALNTAYGIRLPLTSASTFICSISEVPNGYVPDGNGAVETRDCTANPTGMGSGYYIRPASTSEAVVPSEFIDPEPNVASKPADPTVICDATPVDPGLIATASKNSSGCN